MADFGEAVGRELVGLIADLRRVRALSMDDLADRAKLHRTYIGLLERGVRQPTVVAAANIAAALGVRLADLLDQAERRASGVTGDSELPAPADVELVHSPAPRRLSPTSFLSDTLTQSLTGFTMQSIGTAVEWAYHQLDLIDQQLLDAGSPVVTELFELANVSSMLGNLLASGLVRASAGRYARSGPHKYQDLRAVEDDRPHIEVKVALEANRPKGHLPKPGVYMTFRYILRDRSGGYTRGATNRGTVIEIWEIRCGKLEVQDFSLSNTAGDSGKTAVIKGEAFNRFEVVYFSQDMSPSTRLRPVN
jgi:DNA-binding XRE family transcriptional regulator